MQTRLAGLKTKCQEHQINPSIPILSEHSVTKSILPQSAGARTEGAQGCSHGWSAARAIAGAAQPVERGALSLSCPGGAQEDRVELNESRCRGRFVLCPSGARDVGAFFSTGCARGALASPVATAHRPCGAKRGEGKNMKL